MTAKQAMTRIFAYGSLMSGERNHRLLVGARLVGEARTGPAYSLFDLGAFPGLVAGGTHAVVGEVYDVDGDALAALDRLEGHPTLYRRTAIVLEDGRSVETYLLTRAQVEGRSIVPSGSWRAHRTERTR